MAVKRRELQTGFEFDEQKKKESQKKEAAALCSWQLVELRPAGGAVTSQASALGPLGSLTLN